MQLKKKRVEGWEVDYQDWDKFVNEYFGFEPEERSHGYRGAPIYKEYPYEFMADHEANNDSIYEFNPDGEIYEDKLERVEKWMKNPISDSYITHDIFNYIVSKGDLLKGTYYINVCW